MKFPRKQALLSGSPTYITGKACPNGHIAPRYTTSKCCVECTKMRASVYGKTEERKDKAKKYNKDNPHLKRLYDANRRARKIKATPKWCDIEAVKAIYESCKGMGRNFHVDHIVPLNSDIVCGLHVPANLQVLSAEDNVRKSNKVWPDMP